MKRDVCSIEISAFKSNQAKREGERVEDTSHTRPHSGGIPESVSERYMHRHKYLLLTSTHTHTHTNQLSDVRANVNALQASESNQCV